MAIEEASRQGQYLVFDDHSTHSVRVHPNIGKFADYFVPGEKGYGIFADSNSTNANQWGVRVPIREEAMVAAGQKTLFIAGSPDLVDPKDPWRAIRGDCGGLPWAVAAANGEKQAELVLDAPPVFDGLIAVDGSLFMSLRNGHVVCYEGE